MTKLFSKVSLVLLLLIGTLSFTSKTAKSNTINYYIQPIKKSISITVSGTYYNPDTGQCDKTPLLTACNKFIDTNKLKQGEIRWIAVSRELLKLFPYKSKVYIESKNCKLEGEYYVMDCMNKRYKNRIDFLVHRDKKLKINSKILITKL